MKHKYKFAQYVFIEHIYYNEGCAWAGYVSKHKITKLLENAFDFVSEPCYEIEYTNGFGSRVEIESNLFESEKDAYDSILRKMEHSKGQLERQKERIEEKIKKLENNIEDVKNEAKI